MKRIGTVLALLAVLAGALGMWPATSTTSTRATGPIDLTGSWGWVMGTPLGTCVGSATIVQSGTDLSIDFSCFVYLPCCLGVSGSTTGTIDTATGVFVTAGTQYTLSGTATKDGQFISGGWVCCRGSVAGGFSGSRPPPTPTPTLCPGGCPTDTPTATATPPVTPTPTPDAVGGVALDAQSNGGGGSDPRWLITITGAALVTLGGAALYARRRG